MLNEISHVGLWAGFMALVGVPVGWVGARLADELPRAIEASWADASDNASGNASDRASRWPVVLVMALVFALCGWRYAPGWPLGLAAVFCGTLVVLAFTDARSYLLPDMLTLPLMWLGLLVATVGYWTSPTDAIWGAAAGYLLLWSVYHGFRLVTGKEGMGYGDFKLLAAIGAWLGVQALPMIVLGASILGIVMALAMRLMGRAQAGQALPFGPALAMAGAVALLWPAHWPLFWG